MLPVNTLLKERESGTILRVLDEVASGRASDPAATHFVLVDIHASGAIPFFAGKLRVQSRIAADELLVIDEVFLSVTLGALTEHDKTLLARRWRLVEFTRRFGQRMWDERFRGRLSRRLAEWKIFSKPFFYDVLRLYWQRGQTKEAIVTSMWRCGAPGVQRVTADGAPKTGRRRSIQPGAGVAATEEHRQNMRLAWASAPVGRDGRYLRKAWDWMLISRYHEHVNVLPNGNRSHLVEVANYDRVPTFDQFEYHWRQEHPFEVRQLKRLQQRRFDLAFKPLLSGTLPEVRGPGTRYYIDATVLDVYAVSRFNPRRIVGRPTLYVVIDQFSRMVVGIYVGLEPPCWAGAMLAVWNCSVDKVAFCKSYGIDISADMWPTGCMPLHLMGDRGELKSDEADRLSAGFGLDVENARGYSGEAKGVVERMFRTLHAIFGPFLPGYIDKELAGRDQEPAVLRSAMTIEAITRTVINAVLIANLRVVRDYEGWPEVIADGVPFVPVSLWHWGVENLRADVRKYPDLHLKKYLWPHAEMKVTRRGLQLYRGLYYMGAALRHQSWFAHALHTKTVVDVLYHPLVSGSAVALPSSQNGSACEVSLTRRSQKWGDFSFSEIAALELQRKRNNADAAWTNLPYQLAASYQTIEDSALGRRLAKQAKPQGETRAERTRDIRGNREAELNALTSEAVLGTLGDAATEKVSDVENSPSATPQFEDAVTRTADSVRRLFASRRPPQTPPTEGPTEP
jgi:hypothetical protein